MKDSLKRTFKTVMTPELLEAFRKFGAAGGRKGGSAGGKARARRLTRKQRQAIGRKAAAARWAKGRRSSERPR